MSKITRKKLTRGVLLGTEHVHQAIDAIGAADADQVKTVWAPFRLNFYAPVLNDASGIFNTLENPTREGKPMCFPFTLPPLQNHFNASTKVASKTTPQVILDEVSFSFDSRAEVGTIRADSDFKPDDEAVEKCDVDISILEKVMSVSDYGYDKEIVSFRVPGLAIAGSITERLNPVVVDNINQTVDPYKVYILRVAAKGLYGVDSRLVMPSINVSLRFRHPLVVGETGSIQNAPQDSGPPVVQKLEAAAATISIVTPADGTAIEASGVTGGIDTEMTKIDDIFLAGLGGGTNKDGSIDAAKHINASSSYEVIAVPMFQNPSIIHLKHALKLPYLPDLGYRGAFDRRVIPIVHPVIVHHAIAMANYNDPYPAEINPVTFTPGVKVTKKPQSATVEHQVGVGLGRGVRSDAFTYQQVAQANWVPAAANGNRLDRSSCDTSKTDDRFELVNMPLEGTTGVGHTTTGKPIYAGRTQARSNMESSSPSRTGSQEQFIEVRWLIHETDTLKRLDVGDDEEVYVGAGGHWVYLICEKRLAGGKEGQRT